MARWHRGKAERGVDHATQLRASRAATREGGGGIAVLIQLCQRRMQKRTDGSGGKLSTRL